MRLDRVGSGTGDEVDARPFPAGEGEDDGDTVRMGGEVAQRNAPDDPLQAARVAHAAPSVGSFTGIVRGTDGLGLISYYDAAQGHLKVRHCSNVSCSAGTAAVVDGAGLVGLDTSITLGTDGLGLISYLDYTHD